MLTDIPAFYSEWFANRIQEGFVLVRNPYNPVLLTRYDINPLSLHFILNNAKLCTFPKR